MEILHELEDVVRARQAQPSGDSYTAHLFAQGLSEIAKKVGEESVEVLIAALGQSDERLVEEAADLAYHLVVLLVARGLSWSDVEEVLARRRR